MSDTTVSELLGSVRDFLRNEVAPELEGFKAYQLRVALNNLAIVTREQQLLAELNAVDAEIAKCAGLTDDLPVWQGLALALRERRITVDPSAIADNPLMSLLRRRTLIKLAIDNPKYAGGRVATERWAVAATQSTNK